MGVLDQILGGVLGGAQSNPRGALIQAVLGMLLQGGAGRSGGGLTDILSGVLGGGAQPGGLGGALRGGLGGLDGMFRQAGLQGHFSIHGRRRAPTWRSRPPTSRRRSAMRT